MKNLKKVLALVVALTMVLGTVSFAAFTDVAEDSDVYTAVSTLASLNILNGYEDGSFKPDGDITRAEFCAVVCRALGASVSGNAVTGFSDVPADHWASGYIAYAAGQGIVNGMGDGTFAPDANVTYEQAIKMLVVALGFEPMAASKGGYPTGYMVVANTYEMTKGVANNGQSAPASRGVVAQLVYNALDIPVMEQTGFGKDREEYTVQDGTEGKLYKTLLTNLDVVKLDGVVVGTNIIGGNCDIDEVEYAVTYAYQDEDWSKYEEDDDAVIIPVAEGVKADEYFGIASIVYIQEVSNKKFEIIAIMPGEDSEVVELALEDIDEDTDDSAIVYYPSASSSKTSKYKLDKNVVCYYNYALSTLDEIIRDGGALKENEDIEITLIENNGDSSFDMIIAKQYTYDRIDTLEVDRGRFEGNDEAFSFDFDDEELSIKIMNKDGEPMDLADFAEGDVIAYISETGKGKVNSQSATWIELYNLGESAVTGTVDETKEDAVYVDGNEYGNVSGDNIALGDEGTFYLTKTGKIFGFEKDSSVSGNYAYILETGCNDAGFSAAWQVKLLTKNNEIIIYTVRDNFKIDGKVYDEAAEEAGILSDLADDKEFKKNVDKRVITYKLDSKGLIREINTAEVSKDEAKDVEYKADTQKLGKTLEDDTVIFNISRDSMNAASASNINYLVDEAKYDYYIVENDDNEFDCVIITKGGSLIDYSQNVAIVASVTDVTVDDASTNAKKVTYYTAEDDEAKTIIVVDDEDVSVPDCKTDYDDVKVGTFMMFADNGEGTAAAYAVLAEANNSVDADDEAYTIKSEAALENYLAGANNDKNGIFGGYIKSWKSANAGKAITAEIVDNYGDTELGKGEAEFVIKKSVNAYTYYNRSTKNISIKVGDWAAVNSIDVQDGDEATFFLAFTVDGEIVDFITFSTRKTVEE